MMLLLAASIFAVQASTSTMAPDYKAPSNWLCLPGKYGPGKGDLCTTPLQTTALNPNGYGSSGPSPVARDPGVDCFIVYPTVSRDAGMNSDLNPGGGEEKASIVSQFARFSGACRTYAPMYRQMTLGAVTAAAAGADVTAPAMLAYGDVRAASGEAWDEQLAAGVIATCPVLPTA